VGYWSDFIGGLMRVGTDSLLNRIRSDLPILILGGGDDPVGGDKGMGKLVTHYAQTGHQRLRIKIYPEARHEMLNETNREEVFDDIVEWLQTLKKNQ
jgi:alpha-beta hydrolase superfamily lysophospholipase